MKRTPLQRKFSGRNVALSLLLLGWVVGAQGSDALARYNARLDEIARSYKEEFGEIRKTQGKFGSPPFRAGEEQIRQLGILRTKAIADAKLLFEKEQKEPELSPGTPRLTGEQRQKQLMEARRQLFEKGQQAFWERVAREEPKLAELQAARRASVEKAQKAFWTDLFGPSDTQPEGRPIASANLTTQRAEKERGSSPEIKLSHLNFERQLAAAH